MEQHNLTKRIYTQHSPSVFKRTKLVLSVISAGVFSSAVAFLLMVELIKRWGATRMASVTYFTPVIAMFSDMIARHRTPNGYELIGLCFIFLSLWLIQKKVDA